MVLVFMMVVNHIYQLGVQLKIIPTKKYSDSWIYNYLCNQCLSPLTLWVQIRLRRGVLDITLCDQVCRWLAAGRWFSPGTLVSSTKKTDRHNIAEILLKVALNTIIPILIRTKKSYWDFDAYQYLPRDFLKI
jgi:hypothetical protein